MSDIQRANPNPNAGHLELDARASKRPRLARKLSPDPSLTRHVPERGFHRLDLTHPGLRVLHAAPDVYAIDGFLTDDECERLLVKAASAPRLRPSVQTDDVTGETYRDERRTSHHCIVAQREVPSVVRRLARLCQLPAAHWERLKLVRYTSASAERFAAHCDGFAGRVSSCGFVDSNRVVTAFVYLVTLPVGAGGETRFTRLRLGGSGGGDGGGGERDGGERDGGDGDGGDGDGGDGDSDGGLCIRPQRGLCVVHLPARSDDASRDERCEHEALPPRAVRAGPSGLEGRVEGCGEGTTKWVLVAQGWATPKDETLRGVRERDTHRLSDDTI